VLRSVVEDERALLNPARPGGSSETISTQSSTHSRQIATPSGPAITFPASLSPFPQNEQTSAVSVFRFAMRQCLRRQKQ
jgi:hypothetical protein